MTAMPLTRYKYCGYISTPLVKFGSHEQSITIDVLISDNSKKKKAFKKAYNGAKIYLIIAVIIRMIKFEEIYNFCAFSSQLIGNVLKNLFLRK